MTTIHSGDIDCPIAPFLSISSARLRSLILKKHLTTLNAQLRTDKKADPHLRRMILLNMFQIFQITRINFDQYLHIHKHPDTYSTQRDATAQTEHTINKPKRLVRNLSNRMRSEMEKQCLSSYWPSDDNDNTDEELQKDPPEALIDDNYPHKTYTYVFFLISTDAINSTRPRPSSNPTSSTIDRRRSAPIFNFIAAQQLPHLHSSADPSASIFQSSIVSHPILSQR